MRNVIRYYGWFRFLLLVFQYVFTHKIIGVPGIKNPIFLRRKSTDKEVFKKIFLKMEYKFNQVKDVKYIIDAGAYTGLSAIFFKMDFPESKIICIEASRANFLMLKKNLKNYNDVFMVNRALWSETVSLSFIESESKQFGSKVPNEGQAHSAKIESITISEVLKDYNYPYIDLLKIDIEGSEKELFENNFSTWLIKTKYIVIELHDRFKPGCAKAFFNALNTINYSMYLKGENILIVNNDFSKPTQ